MPGLKRPREGADAAASSKTRTKDVGKRPRKDAAAAASSSSSSSKAAAAVPPPAVEADFPRGGGSGLTPLEHAQALREGRAERASAAAGKDLFTDGSARKKGKAAATGAAGGDDAVAAQKEKKRKDWREMKNAKKKKTALGVERAGQGELDHTRVEHLNYKRLAPGSRLLCSVLAVHPLAIVLSLPNQLLGHVPLTNISSVLTERLDAAANASDSESEAASSDDEDEEMKAAGDVPELRDLYKVGDWVRASVVSVKGAGAKSLGREGQEYVREAGRVELSLDPALLNEGVASADLIPGAVLPVTIKSREDHGWTLDAGIGISGFAPLDAAPKDAQVGAVLPAAVTAHTAGSRAFTASLQPAAVLAARLGPTHAPTLNGLLPGTFVTALITNVSASGLSAKLWGFFDASIDPTHLPLPQGKTAADVYTEGQKVKARVLWDLGPHAAGTDPLEATAEKQGGRKLALSAAAHTLKLSPPPGLSHYPIGTKLTVRVVRADKDWGLACEIEDANDEAAPQVFCHISHVADEHIVALSASSGTWKEGSVHAARVTGHAPTDGRVLVSLQPSVLNRAFMRVSEVQVGSIVRGTVARMGPNGNAIFLDLGGSVHGVVFPLHFADVPLRKPEKKYKVGATVKARVLAVDPLKNRISCTLKKSLVGSDLPIVAALQDARPGVVTQGTVSRFIESVPGMPNALLVDLFGGLRALVPAVEATEAVPGAQPLQLKSAFFAGKVVRVRLTHVDYASARITASIRQAAPSYLARLDVDAVTLGQKVDARTAAVHADVVVLELLPSHARALLSLAALAEERGKSVEEVRAELEEGEVITGLTVIDKNKDKGLVILGNSHAQPRSNKAAELQPGHITAGKVIESGREPNAVTVLLPGGVRARLHATDCADEFSDEPLPPVEKEKDSKPLDVVVLSIRGTTKKRAVVSMRPSVLAAARGETPSAPRDAVVESATDLQPKEKRRGYVKAIADSGLFVDLGRGLTARVMIAALFDNYVKDWKPRFRVGQLVEGTVMSVLAAQSKVEFSLRAEPGVSSKDRKGSAAKKAEAGEEPTKGGALRLRDLQKGQKVKGFVRAITDFGVFVQIEGSDVSGLAHKSQLSDNKSADALKAFAVGDRVRAIVLEVNVEKKRLGLGLKPSYFDAEDFAESDAEMADGDASDAELESGEEAESDEEADSDEDIEGEASDSDGDGSDASLDDDDFEGADESLLRLLQADEPFEEESDVESEDGASDEDDSEDASDAASDVQDESEDETPRTAVAPALELSGGFSWSAPDAVEMADAGNSASDSDSDDDEAPEAGTSKAKKRKAKAAAAPQQDMTADLATKAPESTADFERLLLGSPHSSYLWIQFMSFQLQLSDIDKAREVARRALKVISFREEQERMNVWIALLNLENAYGTAETLDTVFKQAAQANDSKTVHLRLLAILEKSDKLDAAEELWRKTAKKFGYSSKVWVGWVQFYLRHDRAEDARKLVPRSMQSLEKRKHVKTVLAIALSEYKLGDSERARTVFEGLVDSHPKRLDIWLQYVDQEARLGEVANVRNLFERILALRQSSKKAKSVLRRWLLFEQKQGSAEGEQSVLARARAWAEQMQTRQQGGEADEAA